ncbi:uncharacterized protein LOC121507986 isoform X2 [Cheilinus undulatus]|uniref:uncharacterized protein LOC121507986 isoform X2 n=1 Tax=Cheilinus undulatus TaxID=241271 RepID=UPI001BD505C2|nr:uncharacterized protein LOC121507986 isoform X2 [Cheilinus undulatus]
MQVVSGSRSLWIYSLLLSSLHLWEGQSTPTPPLFLPPPEIYIHLRTEESAVLVCRAPEGHHGTIFMLYKYREKVDSQEINSSVTEVQFTVRLQEGDSDQQELFCCLYKDQGGRYSGFSPYLPLEHQKDADPTHPIPSYSPPVLSVTPSTGVVKHGDMLSFSCSVPTLPQSLANFENKPVNFVLLRTAVRTGVTSPIFQPQSSRTTNPEPLPGLFTLGPVRGGEEGGYTCLYQIATKKGLVNSTVSNLVHVTIKDTLPLPTLVLQQQTDVWHLLCRGSPAYPGALFSLYLADHDLPVATQRATSILHQVAFPVPVQETPLAFYQCQYTVLLGEAWSNSERSLPLIVTKGAAPPAMPDAPAVDWPLVLGSLSAVVLFLCSLALVVIVAHRKAKAAAEERKKRQEAQFWTQVHAKDHIVDLTLRRASFTSQEWASAGTATETSSRSPLWNSMSTFATPSHQIH